jgi:hypothetical protein
LANRGIAGTKERALQMLRNKTLEPLEEARQHPAVAIAV